MFTFDYFIILLLLLLLYCIIFSLICQARGITVNRISDYRVDHIAKHQGHMTFQWQSAHVIIFREPYLMVNPTSFAYCVPFRF